MRTQRLLPLLSAGLGFLFLAAASATLANEKLPLEKLQIEPPQLGIAMAIEGGFLQYSYTVATAHFLPEEIVPPPQPDGTPSAPYTVMKRIAELETRTMRLNLAEADVRRIDGRKVAPDDLIKELAEPRAILYVSADEPLRAPYLALFKPETLVLHAPAHAAP